MVPFIIYKKNPGGEDILLDGRFPLVSGIFAILAVVSYMFCYKNVTERVEIGKEEKKSSVLKGIGNVITRRSLISIILISICLLLSMLLISAMNAYVYNVYFQNSAGMAYAGLTTTIPMLITAPIAMKLGQTIGKKEATTIGLFGSGLIYLIMYIVKVENMYVFLLGSALAYAFLGIFNTLTWAMITDVIDDLEIKNRQRDDGTVYAIYSFARKLGQAGAVGYVAGTSSQSPEVALGVYKAATLFPAIALLV